MVDAETVERGIEGSVLQYVHDLFYGSHNTSTHDVKDTLHPNAAAALDVLLSAYEVLHMLLQEQPPIYQPVFFDHNKTFSSKSLIWAQQSLHQFEIRDITWISGPAGITIRASWLDRYPCAVTRFVVFCPSLQGCVRA
jgi:hypothetical protein